MYISYRRIEQYIMIIGITHEYHYRQYTLDSESQYTLDSESLYTNTPSTLNICKYYHDGVSIWQSSPEKVRVKSQSDHFNSYTTHTQIK